MLPMLAKPLVEKTKLPNTVYLQKKLDGVRCIWNGSNMLSRTGKPILGLPELQDQLIKNYVDQPLDGELYCEGVSFEDLVSSINRKKKINENLNIIYYVFDIPVSSLTFDQRWTKLLQIFKDSDRILLLETIKIGTENKKKADLNIFKSSAEGTMVRIPDSFYEFGKRSSGIFKIKEFEEEEFTITGVYELSTKEKVIVESAIPGSKRYANGTYYKDGEETPAGVLGGFKVKNDQGIEFEVGSGFTDIQRKEFWDNPPLGKKATIKYQELTAAGIPRFGVFKAIRDYE